MSYLLSLFKIKADFTSVEKLSKEDWLSCAIPEELVFIEKDSYPHYYLEVQHIETKNYIPCFWISKNFQKARIDSKVFMMNPEFEKYAIYIATKIEGIILGQEGELLFIPGIGKIENQKPLLEQNPISIMDVKGKHFSLRNPSEIRNYIESTLD